MKLLFLILSLSSISIAEPLKRYDFSESKMGMEVFIKLYAINQEKANKASKLAYQHIDTLELIFSDYNADSEIRQLNNSLIHKPQKISPDLFKLLKLAQSIHKKSNGAFDPTIRPLSLLWRQSRFLKRLPKPSHIDKALSRVGFQFIKLDETNQTLTFSKPSLSLDCGAFAKGYIIQSALEVLKKHSITSALVDAGGDMAIGEAPPDKLGWKVQIENWDSQPLILKNCGIATSGDRYQFLEIEGKKYSHIINPFTGMALKNSKQVTVISKNATLADALASTFSVISLQNTTNLLQHFRSTKVLTIEGDFSKKTNIWMSPSFEQFYNKK